MPKAKEISAPDLQIWAAYTHKLKLLPGRTRLSLPAAHAPPAAANHFILAMPSGPAAKPAVKIDTGTPSPGLDRASWQKFRSRKMRAARTLDLHGFSAAHAHRATIGFIQRAYTEHLRCVEIITGKGDVLARELPLWLNAPELRPVILAFAYPHAANTGSIRILLKRIQ